MPVDMALPLVLYRTGPHPCRTPLSTRKCGADQPERQDAGPEPRKFKKKVTFADHQGLALTRVKVFSQFDDPIAVPPCPVLPLPAEEDELVLDFTQPSSDYLRFRQSLDQNRVCLERCVLKERALSGTVKVKNLSFEKSVTLRVTFDTWESHAEVDCVYMDQVYPGSDSDTFSFRVCLPKRLQPHQRVEFAVRYQAGGTEYWDSNRGQNYVVLWSSMRRRHQDAADHRGFQLGIHFDRFGSPTCSHGIFPDWPSYAGYEHLGPYY